MTDIFSGGFVVPARMVGGTTYDGGKDGYIDKMWAGYGLQKKVIIAFLVFAVIAVIVYLNTSMSSTHTMVTPTVGGFMGRHRHGVLLDKLHEKGWQVHTRPGCGWCNKQTQEVNGLRDHPINIDCDNRKNAVLCAADPGYPHWKNILTGESYPGYKTPEQLEKLLLLGHEMEDEQRAVEEEAQQIFNRL